jgi:hypothetical protein
MQPVRPLLYASILVSGGCLVLAFAQVEFWNWVIAMAAFTALWLVGLWRRSLPNPDARFLWMPAAGAWGLLVGVLIAAGTGLSFLLVLLAALAFLSAWDLSRLVARLELVRDSAMANRYARPHLVVLGAVLVVSLLIGLVLSNVALTLPFGWIAGMVVLVLILVRVAISLMQRWD